MSKIQEMQYADKNQYEHYYPLYKSSRHLKEPLPFNHKYKPHGYHFAYEALKITGQELIVDWQDTDISARDFSTMHGHPLADKDRAIIIEDDKGFYFDAPLLVQGGKQKKKYYGQTRSEAKKLLEQVYNEILRAFLSEATAYSRLEKAKYLACEIFYKLDIKGHLQVIQSLSLQPMQQRVIPLTASVWHDDTCAKDLFTRYDDNGNDLGMFTHAGLVHDNGFTGQTLITSDDLSYLKEIIAGIKKHYNRDKQITLRANELVEDFMRQWHEHDCDQIIHKCSTPEISTVSDSLAPIEINNKTDDSLAYYSNTQEQRSPTTGTRKPNIGKHKKLPEAICVKIYLELKEQEKIDSESSIGEQIISCLENNIEQYSTFCMRGMSNTLTNAPEQDTPFGFNKKRQRILFYKTARRGKDRLNREAIYSLPTLKAFCNKLPNNQEIIDKYKLFI